MINWIEKSLIDRQRVVVDGEVSNWKSVFRFSLLRKRERLEDMDLH